MTPDLPSDFDPFCPRVTTDAAAYEMSEERLEEIRAAAIGSDSKESDLLIECVEEIDRLRDALEKAEESQERTREGYIRFGKEIKRLRRHDDCDLGSDCPCYIVGLNE